MFILYWYLNNFLFSFIFCLDLSFLSFPLFFLVFFCFSLCIHSLSDLNLWWLLICFNGGSWWWRFVGLIWWGTVTYDLFWWGTVLCECSRSHVGFGFGCVVTVLLVEWWGRWLCRLKGFCGGYFLFYFNEFFILF